MSIRSSQSAVRLSSGRFETRGLPVQVSKERGRTLGGIESAGSTQSVDRPGHHSPDGKSGHALPVGVSQTGTRGGDPSPDTGYR